MSGGGDGGRATPAPGRYVVLGLAPARASWFRRVARWANAAALPVEFVKCVSPGELQARLAGGRRFSAVLVGDGLGGVDRDLFAAAREQGCAVVVVTDDAVTDADAADEVRRRWHELGAAAVISPAFTREQLLEVLADNAAPVAPADPGRPAPRRRRPRRPAGRLLAVTGAGGAGASTVAIALAQGLAAEADEPPTGPTGSNPTGSNPTGGAPTGSAPTGTGPAEARPTGGVLLADLCRWADQAMLHDARRLVPSLQELVEAHRSHTPSPVQVRRQTLRVEARGYRLLLGLRRPHHWVALRPAALEAALTGLQRSFAVTVADIEPDLEGEDDCGSVDVEERHLMARLAAARAELVLAVGRPGMKGLFGLVRVLGGLVDFGVPPARLLPVVNAAPRSPRARAELTAGLHRLLSPSLRDAPLASPVFLPERRVDTALRDGLALPGPLPERLVGAVTAARERTGATPRPAAPASPRPIAPGTLATAERRARPDGTPGPGVPRP